MEGTYKQIGRTGRWILFCGVPMAITAILFVSCVGWAEASLGKAFPYVLYSVPLSLIIATMVAYDYIPEKAVLPCGIAGWILALGLLYWFFWFGPAAYKTGN